jgi:hypothetical protein
MCATTRLTVIANATKGFTTLVISRDIWAYSKFSNYWLNSLHAKGGFTSAQAWYSTCNLVQIKQNYK